VAQAFKNFLLQEGAGLIEQYLKPPPRPDAVRAPAADAP
jgi:hypothetical protein